MSTIYLIGKSEDVNLYKTNYNDINNLPIKNLPLSYFPFFYTDMENSIERMKNLVALRSKDANIDVDQMFSLINTLEESYQPYNKNNIYHIKIVILIIWFLVAFMILKLISYISKNNYSYFIASAIIILLIFSILWSLILTNNRF